MSVVDEPSRPRRCVVCGDPSSGGRYCEAHADLAELDPFAPAAAHIEFRPDGRVTRASRLLCPGGSASSGEESASPAVRPTDRQVLDRIDLPDKRFSAWLEAWRQRWLAGELIRVLVANDDSHVIVVDAREAPCARVSAAEASARPASRTSEEPRA